jgi:multisubunit Na+/H+ antiporter MnhF subunit
VIDLALVLLCLAGLAYLVRIVMGPTLTDRIVALDGLLIVMVAAIITAAVRDGSGLGIDVVLVVALVGFVSTAAAARFVARRGD